MTKIAIIGSREYPNMVEVRDALHELKEVTPNMCIITGGARGVDRVAELWAESWGVPCEVIKPISPKDKFSYLLRNVEIITKADKVFAFWDGESKGTKFVIDYCKARGKSIIIKTSQKGEE